MLTKLDVKVVRELKMHMLEILLRVRINQEVLFSNIKLK